MRILVACDSFKGSCSARVACECIARGLRTQLPTSEVEVCPLADGGEGTLDAVAETLPLRLEQVSVAGPLGAPVQARVGWTSWHDLPESVRSLVKSGHEPMDRVAWLEAASCLGLALIPRERRDPRLTSSYGLGQLLAHTRDASASAVIVGLGGTSTVDVGIGLAQALGVEVPGVPTPAGGGALAKVHAIDATAVLRLRDRLDVVLASDVTNPLVGPRGAARAFAPQKGASPQVVEQLERAIRHYAGILAAACARPRGSDVRRATLDDLESTLTAPGAGAAGGIGFALRCLLSAPLTSGIELIMTCARFDARLARADWVITGEGRLDQSSFEGKVVSGVVHRARALGVGVCVVCGVSGLTEVQARQFGITELETLSDHARDPEDSKRRVNGLLCLAGEHLALRLSRPRR